jgi:hypothetical protein
MTRAHDIKAPDGYLLGGLRRVRSDGTILFQRGWWKAPDEWIGTEVWVHEDERGNPGMRDREVIIRAAPPGMYIATAILEGVAVVCHRTDRPDAKLGWRDPVKLAWANRHNKAPTRPTETADTQ